MDIKGEETANNEGSKSNMEEARCVCRLVGELLGERARGGKGMLNIFHIYVFNI